MSSVAIESVDCTYFDSPPSMSQCLEDAINACPELETGSAIGRIAELERSLEVLMKERNTLIADKTGLEKERDTLCADKANLEKERDTLCADKADLEKERDTLRADKADLEKERDTLCADLTDLQKERDTLSADLTDLKKDRANLLLNKKRQQNTIDALSNQRMRLMEPFLIHYEQQNRRLVKNLLETLS